MGVKLPSSSTFHTVSCNALAKNTTVCIYSSPIAYGDKAISEGLSQLRSLLLLVCQSFEVANVLFVTSKYLLKASTFLLSEKVSLFPVNAGIKFCHQWVL